MANPLRTLQPEHIKELHLAMITAKIITRATPPVVVVQRMKQLAAQYQAAMLAIGD